jgi:hypothetical protein
MIRTEGGDGKATTGADIGECRATQIVWLHDAENLDRAVNETHCK